MFSVLASYKAIAQPFNYFVSSWMILSFVGTLIWRGSCVDLKSVKRNLLTFFIDRDKGLYSPRPDNGDIGPLYKKTKKDSFINKIRYYFSMLVIYVGPAIVGMSMSSATSDNIRLLGGCLLAYFTTMIGGIYMFLLYYTRLKCLYQIQKELGKKLRFY